MAAKQIAILKGIGYRGVYISGRPSPDRVQKILELVDSYSQDDWREFAEEINFSQPDEFYYYETDENPGLSSANINKNYISSRSRLAKAKSRVGVPLQYRIGKFVHDRVFTEGSSGFKIGRVI